MLAVEVWQQILDAIGSVLAWIYSLIPNYGIAIIILTVLVRLVLLPLGIKQVRSMHAMQAVQPKVKAIQAKYKNNKQKAQEEIMKVYQEHGVNPLGGCLPLLLQMPVLIALYAVLRFPPPLPADSGSRELSQEQIQVEMVDALHVPAGSRLQEAMTAHSGDWVYGTAPGLHFVGANLLCSASEAGTVSEKVVSNYTIKDDQGKVIRSGQNAITMDCGKGAASKLPMYFLILFMAATTYFQQWQMQRAAPPGSAQKQQQMIARIMPIMFLFFFWRYPSGMVLYWATSNVWQVGQQHFLLRAIKREAAAAEASGKPKKPAKKGFMARLMEQAQEQRQLQDEQRRGGGKAEPDDEDEAPGGEGKSPKPKQGKGPGGGGKGSGGKGSGGGGKGKGKGSGGKGPKKKDPGGK